jgi:hypothetical protein
MKFRDAWLETHPILAYIHATEKEHSVRLNESFSFMAPIPLSLD